MWGEPEIFCTECEAERNKKFVLSRQKANLERRMLMKEKWFNEELNVEELLGELGLKRSIGVLINGIKAENSTKIHTHDDVRIVLSDVKDNMDEIDRIFSRNNLF